MKDLKVRTGDTLVINFGGAKLQIAPYSTVEIDSAIYSRTLHEGDDIHEQWDLIYSFLKKQVMNSARQKLAEFSEELKNARR